MYTFCSCDATMIPDVDHHQYFSFWDPWLQHYKRMSPAYMDGVFLSYFYLCFNLASEHFLFLDFSYGSILMSERISGRHALRHLHYQDNTHDLAVFALLGFLSAGLHFLGYTGLRARHLYFYALLHSRRWLAALPSSCFRAPGNLHSLAKLRFTASQKSERNSSEHGDEGARGDVSE